MYNDVNYLGTSEWVEFTRTICEVSYPLDHTWPIRRQCKGTISPYVYRDIISFFTSAGEVVLDPFASCGEALLGAALCGRMSVGIERSEDKCKLYEEVCQKYGVSFGQIVEKENSSVHDNLLVQAKMFNEEARRYLEVYKKNHFDFIVTSLTNEPYYVDNTEERQEYVKLLKKSCKEMYRVLDENKYMCFFTCDRSFNGKYYTPSSLFIELFEGVGFVFKGKKIFYNKAKGRNTKAYGVGQRYVPNIEHEELIIMQKEG